jgi:exonuclease VII small subunit
MPQARRSTSTRSRSRFKQPAALKRLTTSLDTAQKAIADLRKESRRDVGKGATDLYGDLRKFVSDARRDSNKLAKALQREFDQAQKQLSKAAQGKRATTARATSTSRRSTTSRSTSSRSTSSRGTSRRKSSTSSGTRRSSGGSSRSGS